MSGLVLELAVIEAAQLTDLVGQFAGMVTDGVDDDALEDPAIARLVPDAYRDDRDAAAEFRRLTQTDLLDRRRADAALVLDTLRRDGMALRPDAITDAEAAQPMQVRLDEASVAAWLRTLTAIRLVLATRLGITSDADDLRHPRYAVYHWLGFRLEGLLDAVDR